MSLYRRFPPYDRLDSLTLVGSISGELTLEASPTTTDYTIVFPPAVGSMGEVLSIASVAGTVATLEWSAGGGGSSDSFYVWQGDSGSITATSSTDIASLVGDGIITTSFNAMTDTGTISLGTVPIANGGTGLTTLGAANQQLRVNAGATALEYFTPSGGGDVTGPGSSTADGIPTFSGTGGKTLQNTTNTISGNALRLASDTAGNAKLYLAASATTYGLQRITSGLRLWANSTEFSGAASFGSAYSLTLDQPNDAFQFVGSTNARLRLYPNTATGAAYLEVPAQTGAGSYGGQLVIQAGSTNNTGGTRADAYPLWLFAGDVANTNASSVVSGVTVYGGGATNAGGAIAGGPVTITGGNAAGSGAGGKVTLQGGTSGSGTPGVIQIGRTGTTGKNILNNLLETAGANTATLTNSPVAGDPAGYLRITINGTDRLIPFWPVP